jgi:hypothetical protein
LVDNVVSAIAGRADVRFLAFVSSVNRINGIGSTAGFARILARTLPAVA